MEMEAFVVLQTVGNYHRIRLKEEARGLFGCAVKGADNIEISLIILLFSTICKYR